ncbi:hypothetical protein H5410_002561 [Solanum commersonii]|uniref:Uncharacterized protein n=1 Tax=Solanum commersonii TaxID=4109 RepID=A0A9J6B2H3_SOLCO|nr:hypothetical protein H5410_002561 [Solanum commersonii]
MPIASTNIQNIKAKYLKDQVDKKQKEAVTTRSTPAEALPLSPTHVPSGIYIATTTLTDATNSFTTVSRPPLTHGSLIRMGQMTLSTDRQATCLEASISGMIQKALTNVVTLLNTTIDALAARIAVKRNKILRNAKFNLASHRNDMNHPSFQYAKPSRKWIKRRGKKQSTSRRSVLRSSTVLPNDPEYEDAKGKTLQAMS